MIDTDDARLGEYDKLEWRDICRVLRPDWTDEDFEAAWAEFVILKQQRFMH